MVGKDTIQTVTKANSNSNHQTAELDGYSSDFAVCFLS